MNVPTRAPAFVVVFEVEEPVRVMSPGGDEDAARAAAWMLADKYRAMAFYAACDVAAKAAAA